MAKHPTERLSTLSEEERERLRQEGLRLRERRRRFETWYEPHLAHIRAKSDDYYQTEKPTHLRWWQRLLVKLKLKKLHEP